MVANMSLLLVTMMINVQMIGVKPLLVANTPLFVAMIGTLVLLNGVNNIVDVSMNQFLVMIIMLVLKTNVILN
jgi:hypothetical protein